MIVKKNLSSKDLRSNRTYTLKIGLSKHKHVLNYFKCSKIQDEETAVIINVLSTRSSNDKIEYSVTGTPTAL